MSGQGDPDVYARAVKNNGLLLYAKFILDRNPGLMALAQRGLDCGFEEGGAAAAPAPTESAPPRSAKRARVDPAALAVEVAAALGTKDARDPEEMAAEAAFIKAQERSEIEKAELTKEQTKSCRDANIRGFLELPDGKLNLEAKDALDKKALEAILNL